MDGHFSDAVKKNFTSQDFRFTAKGSTLYAVLGIPINMPVFNGGDSDTLAVMS